jgi:pimeloyl-ACP methyl ester carboxylesterase
VQAGQLVRIGNEVVQLLLAGRVLYEDVPRRPDRAIRGGFEQDVAARAAERIPGAELLAIDQGGHMLLGSEDLIGQEVARFLAGSRVG